MSNSEYNLLSDIFRWIWRENEILYTMSSKSILHRRCQIILVGITTFKHTCINKLRRYCTNTNVIIIGCFEFNTNTVSHCPCSCFRGTIGTVYQMMIDDYDKYAAGRREARDEIFTMLETRWFERSGKKVRITEKTPIVLTYWTDNEISYRKYIFSFINIHIQETLLVYNT